MLYSVLNKDYAMLFSAAAYSIANLHLSDLVPISLSTEVALLPVLLSKSEHHAIPDGCCCCLWCG